MSDEQRKKLCQFCAMEIPVAARKCPYCRADQHRLAMVVHYVGIGLAFVFLPGIIGVSVFLPLWIRHVVGPGREFAEYRNKVHVIESHLEFGQDSCGPTVTVIGRVRNETGIKWHHTRVQVEFYDANGKLIDAEQQYGKVYLPPLGKSEFRVCFRRQFPKLWYASHAVRVVYAEEATSGFY